MNATIKRGTVFTMPAWSARRRGDRTLYATVTRVARGIVYYRLDTDRATTPTHRVRLSWVQQYASVVR